MQFFLYVGLINKKAARHPLCSWEKPSWLGIDVTAKRWPVTRKKHCTA